MNILVFESLSVVHVVFAVQQSTSAWSGNCVVSGSDRRAGRNAFGGELIGTHRLASNRPIPMLTLLLITTDRGEGVEKSQFRIAAN